MRVPSTTCLKTLQYTYGLASCSLTFFPSAFFLTHLHYIHLPSSKGEIDEVFCPSTINADTWWASSCSMVLPVLSSSLLLLEHVSSRLWLKNLYKKLIFSLSQKKGNAIIIRIQNRNSIFKAWEIMMITAHWETGSGFPYTKSLAHLLSQKASTCPPLPCCSCASTEIHFPLCLSQWEKYHASSLILYLLRQI